VIIMAVTQHNAIVVHEDRRLRAFTRAAAWSDRSLTGRPTPVA
jgi:hypothetical protein